MTSKGHLTEIILNKPFGVNNVYRYIGGFRKSSDGEIIGILNNYGNNLLRENQLLLAQGHHPTVILFHQ
jgi:hypothetical protein